LGHGGIDLARYTARSKVISGDLKLSFESLYRTQRGYYDKEIRAGDRVVAVEARAIIVGDPWVQFYHLEHGENTKVAETI